MGTIVPAIPVPYAGEELFIGDERWKIPSGVGGSHSLKVIAIDSEKVTFETKGWFFAPNQKQFSYHHHELPDKIHRLIPEARWYRDEKDMDL